MQRRRGDYPNRDTFETFLLPVLQILLPKACSPQRLEGSSKSSHFSRFEELQHSQRVLEHLARLLFETFPIPFSVCKERSGCNEFLVRCDFQTLLLQRQSGKV